MDWRQVADLEVEERYWRRRLEAAKRAENEARALVHWTSRGGGRVPAKMSLGLDDAEADVRRISRRLDLVAQMKAARDAEGCAA